MAKAGWRRKVILCVGAATLATLTLGGVALWKIAPRIVTWAALRDARKHSAAIGTKAGAGAPGAIFDVQIRLWGSRPPLELAIEEATKSLAARYGSLIRGGYFDHSYLMESIPAAGFTPEAFPVFLLIGAYGEASSDKFKDDFLLTPPESNEAAIGELLSWVRPVLRSPKAKEALVSLLIEPYEPLPGRKEEAGPMKMLLLLALTFREPGDYGKQAPLRPEEERLLKHILSAIPASEWSAVLEHSHHPRERVRAGSFLLLCHHPERERFLERAREALGDPSPLVRIAAAGTLACHGDPGGQLQLIAGLAHDRWEVRWWCGKSLVCLGGGLSRLALYLRQDREPHPLVKLEIEEMLEQFR